MKDNDLGKVVTPPYGRYTRSLGIRTHNELHVACQGGSSTCSTASVHASQPSRGKWQS